MKDELSDETRIAMARAVDLVIERAGSVHALARALGITSGAISHWRTKIPTKQVLPLEAMTGIRREILRPDLFGVNHLKREKLVSRPIRIFKSRAERLFRRAVL